MLLFWVTEPFYIFLADPTQPRNPATQSHSSIAPAPHTPRHAVLHGPTICSTRIAVHPPTAHYPSFIIPHACRLTIAPFLSLGLLTRSGWLAYARDDVLLGGFCSYVLFSQLRQQLRFTFTVVKFCIDFCSACMLRRCDGGHGLFRFQPQIPAFC